MNENLTNNLVCSNCGTTNTLETKFCINCGNDLQPQQNSENQNINNEQEISNVNQNIDKPTQQQNTDNVNNNTSKIVLFFV